MKYRIKPDEIPDKATASQENVLLLAVGPIQKHTSHLLRVVGGVDGVVEAGLAAEPQRLLQEVPGVVGWKMGLRANWHSWPCSSRWWWLK